uniref:Uncharacterized protein n=1 Tax=Avena sativa TaxID=4498 RepID=A0ACD5YQ92_AVESA
MASVGRSRSRRRGEGGGSFERDAVHSAVDHHVAGSLRKQASNSGVLSHTQIDEEFRKSKPRQTSCVPMKKLIDEEFSKDVNARHTSPGAPSLEKAQDIEGSFALTHEIPHSDYRRHTPCLDAHMWSPYTEECMCQASLGNPESVAHIKKGSREIAREITKQMRASRGGDNRKQVLQPDTSTVLSDESSEFMSSLTKLKTSETVYRSSELCDSWDSSSFNSSPAHSNESSVIKEAKKHLSSRWKIAHQFQHQAPDNNGFSVLGDMFALSDQESPKGELQRKGVPGSCSNPLGISSKDGWRGVAPSNSARSKSIPSSLHQGVQKSSSRKRTSRKNEFSMLKDVLKIGPHDSENACHSKQRKSLVRGSTFHGDDQVSPNDEERMMIDHEVHVSSQKPTDVIDMPDSSEQTLAHTVDSGYELDGVCHLNTSSAVFEQNKEPLSPAKLNQQMHQPPLSALDFRPRVLNLDNLQIQAEGIENHLDHDYSGLFIPPTVTESPVGINHHHDSDNQALWIHPTGPESPMSSNNDDQPSPVSVLESSLDTEEVYSGDFEKISADIQGLRMQLQLLKAETADDPDDETDHPVASDDEIASTNQPLPELEISDAFRDEAERDFSYVLDMLTLLGIDAAYQDGQLDMYCFSEYPAGPDLFDILENKYSSLILWPRSERMLLFDLTNAVVAEIMTSLVHHGSKGLLRRFSSRWDHEGFVEDVWQRVFQLRQEMDCNQADPLMMDLELHGSEDGIDLVGGEIGTLVLDGLVEETVAEFLVGRQSGRFCG